MNRQIYIDRLLESENLTDNLEDSEANSLLNWGVGQIDSLIVGLTDEEEAGAHVNRLMHVMRGLNSLAGSPGDVTHEAVADLLDRYDQATGGVTKVETNEHHFVSEHVSKMQPGEAIAYLTEWLQSKKS